MFFIPRVQEKTTKKVRLVHPCPRQSEPFRHYHFVFTLLNFRLHRVSSCWSLASGLLEFRVLAMLCSHCIRSLCSRPHSPVIFPHHSSVAIIIIIASICFILIGRIQKKKQKTLLWLVRAFIPTICALVVLEVLDSGARFGNIGSAKIKGAYWALCALASLETEKEKES